MTGDIDSRCMERDKREQERKEEIDDKDEIYFLKGGAPV